VVVHSLVLLSIIDNYNRITKDTCKRVVGVLLGSSFKGTVDGTNSYAAATTPITSPVTTPSKPKSPVPIASPKSSLPSSSPNVATATPASSPTTSPASKTATPALATNPPAATPPIARTPAATPPVTTPPIATPLVATPPATTPLVATPLAATPPATTPPVATPPLAVVRELVVGREKFGVFEKAVVVFDFGIDGEDSGENERELLCAHGLNLKSVVHRREAKKVKQLLKGRLSRERQIYEMRKRAELKAAVSKQPWEVVDTAATTPYLFCRKIFDVLVKKAT
ncbi:hypothetical protein V8G54_019409, partial [Vigna mungo]